ncbi:zinc finger protein 91 [Patella vulgata]|uniref:zinc finger protein 91 n=1 Tax=Patella vulgata TaxID=6465 RepID=UPI0024A9C7C9|nr:zinc finger protein 91 [Patella vulgata]
MALNSNIKMEYMDSEIMPDAHNFSLEETVNALETVNVCHSHNPMDGLIFSPLLSKDIKMEPPTDLNMEQEHFIDQKEQFNDYSHEEFQEPIDLEMTPDQLQASFNIQPPIHVQTRKFKKSTNTKQSWKKNKTRQRKVDSTKTDSRIKNSKNVHHKPNKSVTGIKKAQQNKTFSKTIKKNHVATKTAKQMAITSKKHQCELCNVIFPQKKMLVKHKKVHKKIKKTFPCTTCKESFSDIISLLKHSRIHVIKTNCNVCSKSFNDAATFKEHKKTHMREKPFKCDVCSKSFFNVTSLKSHGRSHLSKKLFECDVCKKSFRNRMNLSYHMASHKTIDKNLESEPPKPDSIEDKAHHLVDGAPTSSTILKPKIKATPSKKSVDCDVSSKSFKSSPVLKYHMRSHKIIDKNLETEQPPNLDSIEDKADETVDEAPTSSKMLKPKIKTTPSKKSSDCDICSKSFKSSRALKFHVSSHKIIDKNLETEQPAKLDSIEDKAHDIVDGATTTSHKMQKPRIETTPSKNSTVCGICNRSFKTCHMRSHENPRRKPSTIENKADDKSTVGILKPRTCCKTPAKSRFKCDVCNKSLKTKMALRFHSKTHKSINLKIENDGVHKASKINKMLNVTKTFECHVCGKSFKNKRALNFHSKTHKILRKSLEKEPLKTDHGVGEEDTCTNFDDTDGDVDGAVDSGGEAEDNTEDASDITDEEQVECPVSFEPFACLENQEIHRKRHSSKKTSTSNPANFMCQVCGKNLSSKDSLQTHSRLHTGEKPFVCDICGTAFSDKGALTKHSVTHSRERNYCCEICGRGFGLAGLLTRHMSVHSDKKPFKCKVCDKAYKRKTECNIHFRKQHCNLEVNVYKEIFEVERAECNLCQRLVKKKYMKEHMKSHRVRVRSFACDVCPLSFVRKSTLLRHMKTHTGKKPYKCDRKGCEMAYLAKSDLLRHIRNFHDKFRPFTCDVCQRDFFDKTRLELHSSEHTGKYRYKCNNCGKNFNYRSRYLKHLARTLKCKRKQEQKTPKKSDSVGQKKMKRARFTNNGKSTPAKSDVANSQKPELVAKPLVVSHPLLVTPASPKQPNPNGEQNTKTLDDRGLLENEEVIEKNKSSGDSDLPEKSKFPASKSTDVKESQTHRINLGYKCDVCNDRFSLSKDLQTHIMLHLKAAMSPRADAREVTQVMEKTPAPGVNINSQEEKYGQWLNQREDSLFDAPQQKAFPSAVIDEKVFNDSSVLSNFGAAECSDSADVADDDSDYNELPAIDDKGVKEQDVLTFEKTVHTEVAELKNQEKSEQEPVNINGNKAMEVNVEMKAEELNKAEPLNKLFEAPQLKSFPSAVIVEKDSSMLSNNGAAECSDVADVADVDSDYNGLPVIDDNGVKEQDGLTFEKSVHTEVAELKNQEKSELEPVNINGNKAMEVSVETKAEELNNAEYLNKLFDAPPLKAFPSAVIVEKDSSMLSNSSVAEYSNGADVADDNSDYNGVPAIDDNGAKEQDGLTFEKSMHTEVAELKNQEKSGQVPVNINGNKAMEVNVETKVEELNKAEPLNKLFDAPQLKSLPSAVIVEKDSSTLSNSGAAESSDGADVADVDSDYDGLQTIDVNGVKEQDGLTFEKSVHTEVAELKNQEKSGQEPVNINGNKAMEVNVEAKTEELNNAEYLNKLFDAPQLKAFPSAVIVEKDSSMLSKFGVAECSDGADVADDDSEYDGLPAIDVNGVKEQDGLTFEKSVHTEVAELKNQEKSELEPVNINGNKAMEVNVEIKAEELNNAKSDESHLRSNTDNKESSSVDNKEPIASAFFDDGDSDDSMVINVSSILPKNIF